MNGPKQLILLSAVPVFALVSAFCGAATAPQTGSASPTPSATAGGDSFAPMFSANGRWVVFLSYANNLVANDDLAPHLDVFVHDLNTTNTILVSVNTSGIGGGNASSHSPSISSNGQVIAFESAADNLVAGDTNGTADVFVRDVPGGTTTLVSLDNLGTSGGNGPSSNPLISQDGRWVIFESGATNLVANDTNGVADVFARDRMNGVTLMVSDGATAAGPGVGPSGSPQISADARFVVFSKVVTHAMPAFGTSSHEEIYLWDQQTATTTWVTTNMASEFTGAPYGFSCFNPVVSVDGRFVAFLATERYATSARLFRRDLLLGTNAFVMTNVPLRYVPQMSSNGRFIAAPGNPGNPFSPVGLHVWDGTQRRVSTLCTDFPVGNSCGESPAIAANGFAMAYIWPLNGVFVASYPDWIGFGASRSTNGSARRVANLSEPAISADGQRVAFETAAPDLVANDLNLASDIFVRDLQTSTTRLVSRRHVDRPSVTAAGQLTLNQPALNADGRVVAFSSGDNILVPYDTNGFADVLVADLVSGSNYLVGAGLVIGHVDLWFTNFFLPNLPTYNPVLSADGRFIAFERTEVALGASYTTRQVYRQELGTGTWKRVNQPFAPFGADGAEPAMSSDGRFVAFQSHGRASDLDGLGTADGSTSLDVFVRDMAASNLLTRTVSLSTNGQAGTGESRKPVFSPDGQWIAFQSTSRYLVTNSIIGGDQLFARHLATARTRLVSYKPDGSGQALGAGYASPVFSADSRYLFFQDTNVASATAIYRHDLAKAVRATNDVVCANCAAPSSSADGRWVVYETRGTATVSQVFFKHMQTGHASLISSNASGAGGNGPSFAPQISHDARYVVFASRASDLVGNDNNGVPDVFFHDRWTGTILLASLNAQGTASGNGPSSSPALAADGRTIAFLSHASDLLPGDFNDKRDVFVLRLGGADTDADGMEDDWEMAYFSTLARSGSGDFDGDGLTDLEEFRAGTDPLNTGSVLRVLTLTSPANENKTLLWSAVPGRTYRVQFTSVVSSPLWTDLPGKVTAVGTTASKADEDAGMTFSRFYRVLVVQ